MQVAILVLGLLAVAVVAVVGFVQAQRRRDALAALALSRGWVLTTRDDQWVSRWQGAPFGQGDDHRAANVLTGTWADRPFVAFDYSFETSSTDSQGRRSTTTHRFGVVALALPCWLPTVEVLRESLLTRVARHLGLDDIELESEEFNRRFRVRAADRKLAVDVLHPRTMEALLAGPLEQWRIEGCDLLTWQDTRFDPVELEPVLAALEGITAGVPDFVWKDHSS